MYGIVDPDIVVLNYFYQVVPGELTIVTGVPNSGKSEWIDALLCNLNEIAGWKFALCSMENKVRLFIDDFQNYVSIHQKMFAFAICNWNKNHAFLSLIRIFFAHFKWLWNSRSGWTHVKNMFCFVSLKLLLVEPVLNSVIFSNFIHYVSGCNIFAMPTIIPVFKSLPLTFQSEVLHFFLFFFYCPIYRLENMLENFWRNTWRSLSLMNGELCILFLWFILFGHLFVSPLLFIALLQQNSLIPLGEVGYTKKWCH